MIPCTVWRVRCEEQSLTHPVMERALRESLGTVLGTEGGVRGAHVEDCLKRARLREGEASSADDRKEFLATVRDESTELAE